MKGDDNTLKSNTLLNGNHKQSNDRLENYIVKEIIIDILTNITVKQFNGLPNSCKNEFFKMYKEL